MLAQYLNAVQCKEATVVLDDFREFPAICGCFSAIFSDCQQLQMFCGKFWNPKKKLKTISQYLYQYNVIVVYGVFSHFRQFLAVLAISGTF